MSRSLTLTAATFVAAGLLMILPALADAQTIMVDCTGSMANASEIHVRLVEEVAEVKPLVDSFALCLFSSSALGAKSVPVVVQGRAGKSRIEHVNQTRERKTRNEIRTMMVDILKNEQPSTAKITNLRSALMRAGTERGAVLLVTDGKDETKRGASKLASGTNVIVVLCPAKGDLAELEDATLHTRQRFVNAMLPDAAVFACHQLPDAVKLWAARVSGVGQIKAAHRR